MLMLYNDFVEKCLRVLCVQNNLTGFAVAFRKAGEGSGRFITASIDLPDESDGLCGLLELVLKDGIYDYESAMDEIHAIPGIGVQIFKTDEMIPLTFEMSVDTAFLLAMSLPTKRENSDDCIIVAFLETIENRIRPYRPDLAAKIKERRTRKPDNLKK